MTRIKICIWSLKVTLFLFLLIIVFGLSPKLTEIAISFFGITKNTFGFSLMIGMLVSFVPYVILRERIR